MPGGCCLLGVCCPPNEQKAALTAKVEEILGGSPAGTCEDVADWVLAHFDLVPKGVGAAIVEGYRDAFEEEEPP